MSNGLQPHFTREYLHIKPVQQAPNPFIPNEADRIFVPKDDPVIKFARSLQSYNPNLKDWADREEGRLMEEGKQEAMKVWLESGGDAVMKGEWDKRMEETPSLITVNPYSKQFLDGFRAETLFLQRDLEFAEEYKMGNWKDKSPEELAKGMDSMLANWYQKNQTTLDKMDKRVVSDMFYSNDEKTIGYFKGLHMKEVAESLVQERKEYYQNRVMEKSVSTLKEYRAGKTVIEKAKYKEDEDRNIAVKKNMDAALDVIRPIEQLFMSQNMSQKEVYTATKEAFESQILSDAFDNMTWGDIKDSLEILGAYMKDVNSRETGKVYEDEQSRRFYLESLGNKVKALYDTRANKARVEHDAAAQDERETYDYVNRHLAGVYARLDSVQGLDPNNKHNIKEGILRGTLDFTKEFKTTKGQLPNPLDIIERGKKVGGDRIKSPVWDEPFDPFIGYSDLMMTEDEAFKRLAIEAKDLPLETALQLFSDKDRLRTFSAQMELTYGKKAAANVTNIIWNTIKANPNSLSFIAMDIIQNGAKKRKADAPANPLTPELLNQLPEDDYLKPVSQDGKE